jgi:hypothetical protein
VTILRGQLISVPDSLCGGAAEHIRASPVLPSALREPLMGPDAAPLGWILEALMVNLPLTVISFCRDPLLLQFDLMPLHHTIV